LVARLDVAGAGRGIRPEESSLRTSRRSVTSMHRNIR
jgi:hypothetical protein